MLIHSRLFVDNISDNNRKSWKNQLIANHDEYICLSHDECYCKCSKHQLIALHKTYDGHADYSSFFSILFHCRVSLFSSVKLRKKSKSKTNTQKQMATIKTNDNAVDIYR